MTFVGSVARREGESMAQAMDRMKGIGREALQMMQSSLFSPEQGAEGLRQLAQAGLSAEDALKTLPAVLNLATVGEESVGQAAFSTVTIMEAFHKTAGETGTVVDELAKAAAMSTTSVAGISASMKQASTVGEMFNISLEDTLAGLALLADRGIRNTQAGTAWRQMIQGLYAPTEKQAQAMQKLGVQAYDADHNMRPLATIIGELRQKLSGYDKESQNSFMTALTDQRGMKALSALIDQFDQASGRRSTRSRTSPRTSRRKRPTPSSPPRRASGRRPSTR
jgi:TP901 family phage tail tape measure protein